MPELTAPALAPKLTQAVAVATRVHAVPPEVPGSLGGRAFCAGQGGARAAGGGHGAERSAAQTLPDLPRSTHNAATLIRQRAALEAAGHTLERRNLLTAHWTPDNLLAFLAPLPVADWFNRAAPMTTPVMSALTPPPSMPGLTLARTLHLPAHWKAARRPQSAVPTLFESPGDRYAHL